MTTVEGLFGAGDAVGGTPHAFSSGSFTEGRLAAKAACRYIDDGKGEGIRVSDEQIEKRKTEIYKPMETYKIYRNEITGMLSEAAVSFPELKYEGITSDFSPAN